MKVIVQTPTTEVRLLVTDEHCDQTIKTNENEFTVILALMKTVRGTNVFVFIHSEMWFIFSNFPIDYFLLTDPNIISISTGLTGLLQKGGGGGQYKY